MVSVKETDFYNEVIEEFTYPFGQVFIFEGFVVTELNESKIHGWEEAQIMASDISKYFNLKGENLINISNRIYSFSLDPTGWANFFKKRYSLKLYCIVTEKDISAINATAEKFFFKDKLKQFMTIQEAISFVKNYIAETS